MAYGRGGFGGGGYRRGGGGGFGGGKPKADSTRLTGLFPSRNRRGLHVGGIKADQLEGIRALVKKALTEEKGITFFLWKNDRDEGGPEFTITAALALDEDGKRSSRRIEADDRPAPKAKAAVRRPDPDDDDGPEADDTPDL